LKRYLISGKKLNQTRSKIENKSQKGRPFARSYQFCKVREQSAEINWVG